MESSIRSSLPAALLSPSTQQNTTTRTRSAKLGFPAPQPNQNQKVTSSSPPRQPQPRRRPFAEAETYGAQDDARRWSDRREHNERDAPPRRQRQQQRDDYTSSDKGPRDRQLFIDTSSLGREQDRDQNPGTVKASHKRKPSKHQDQNQRDGRLPRAMTQLASSAGAGAARALLPSTWATGTRDKEKDKDKDKDRYRSHNGEDDLLRPVSTRDTRRSRWGSESTAGGTGTSPGIGTGSRKGSLLDREDEGGDVYAYPPSERTGIGLVRRREIRTQEDLEQVRRMRKQGEEHLRGALSSMGQLATDTTRRLDYTYYNLLEKIASLNSTVGSLYELSTSIKMLKQDFDRETTELDQEIRRQLGEFKGFEAQMQKIDALEERMKAGRKKAQELNDRLDAVRKSIAGWEKRETDWQARTSRNLRILWMVVAASLLVLVVAVVLQNTHILERSGSASSPDQLRTRSGAVIRAGRVQDPFTECEGLSRVSQRRPPSTSLSIGGAPTTRRGSDGMTPPEPNPLSIFDEL